MLHLFLQIKIKYLKIKLGTKIIKCDNKLTPNFIIKFLYIKFGVTLLSLYFFLLIF